MRDVGLLRGSLPPLIDVPACRGIRRLQDGNQFIHDLPLSPFPLPEQPAARSRGSAVPSDLIVGDIMDESALLPPPAMADRGRMKTRTELIRALVEPELQAQLRRAAQEQDRSLSWTVHEILAAWAQQRQRQQGQEQAA